MKCLRLVLILAGSFLIHSQGAFAAQSMEQYCSRYPVAKDPGFQPPTNPPPIILSRVDFPVIEVSPFRSPFPYRAIINEVLESARQAPIVYRQDCESRFLGLHALQAADEAYTQNKMDEGSVYLDVAVALADVALSINPITAFPKDLYEALLGKNFFTQRDLNSWERGFAILGVVTGGLSGGLAKAGILVSDSIAKLAIRAGMDASRVLEGVRVSKNLIHEAGEIRQFNPIKVGPLSGDEIAKGVDVAQTFRSATYFATKNRQPIKLYRTYSNEITQLGPFWSRTQPTGPYQATIDLALDPRFGNKATRWVEVTLPPGHTLYEGIAAPIIKPGIGVELLGGGNQVYLQDIVIQPEWITATGKF